MNKEQILNKIKNMEIYDLVEYWNQFCASSDTLTNSIYMMDFYEEVLEGVPLKNIFENIKEGLFCLDDDFICFYDDDYKKPYSFNLEELEDARNNSDTFWKKIEVEKLVDWLLTFENYEEEGEKSDNLDTAIILNAFLSIVNIYQDISIYNGSKIVYQGSNKDFKDDGKTYKITNIFNHNNIMCIFVED